MYYCWIEREIREKPTIPFLHISRETKVNINAALKEQKKNFLYTTTLVVVVVVLKNNLHKHTHTFFTFPSTHPKMEFVMEYGLKLYMPESSKEVKKMVAMEPEKLGRKVEILGGLRKVEKRYNLTLTEFAELLSSIMSQPKLDLLVDLYFDSYSCDEKKVPKMMYLLGFGHLMEQTLLRKGTWKMAYLRHLTCMDRPYFDTDKNAVEPKLGHDHEIDCNLGSCESTGPYARRPTRQGADLAKMTDKDLFFANLASAYSCNLQRRYYEAWAFSLSSLDLAEKDDSLYVHKMGIFCQLAISGAHLAVHPEVTWKCLEQAFSFHDCVPQRWQWSCAVLETLVTLGLFEKERHVYETCRVDIPEKSAWHENFVTVHLNGLVHQIENKLVECISKENMRGRVPKYEAADHNFLMRSLKELLRCCERVVTPGAQEYYKALVHYFRCIVKQMRNAKEDHLKHAMDWFCKCVKLLPGEDWRCAQALQLEAYLENDIPVIAEITNHWQTSTRTKNSDAASETWIKIGLFNVLNDEFREWFSVDNYQVLRQGLEDYRKATHGKGYRKVVFNYLNSYYKRETEEEEGMESDLCYRLKTEVEYNSWRAPDEEEQVMTTPTSKDYISNRYSTEAKAYNIGFKTCELQNGAARARLLF